MESPETIINAHLVNVKRVLDNPNLIRYYEGFQVLHLVSTSFSGLNGENAGTFNLELGLNELL